MKERIQQQKKIPSEYTNLPQNLHEWLEINEPIPKEFLHKIEKVNYSGNIKNTILSVKQAMFTLYENDKRDSAKSFRDSRFTSLEKMIDRRMATCGSATKIVGVGLRTLGIPVKFIHGILGSQKKSFIKRVLLKNRHAWLEVYVPATKKWMSVDVTRPDFSLFPDAEKIKEYHNWDELRLDYQKRDF